MAEESTTAGKLRCLIVTPEATVLDKQADSIVVTLFDGECGILPGKSPMVGRLGFGELRLSAGNSVERFYVDGGFVQVNDNVVSILTGNSIPQAELKADESREQLEKAREMVTKTPEESAIKQRLVDQSRAQLRLAERS